MRRWALSLALLAFPSWAADLTLVSATGEVHLAAGGKTRPGRNGEPLPEAFSLRTGDGAVAVLQAKDGAQWVLYPASEIEGVARESAIRLVDGGLSLWSDSQTWSVLAGGNRLRATGLLRLRRCHIACPERPGIHGKTNAGEVVVEHPGGRQVLRDRLFWMDDTGGKPETLTEDPGLIGAPANFAAARRAKAEMAVDIERGLQAFKQGDFARAKAVLAPLRAAAPAESVLAFYLGLIALELGRHDEALTLLQQYARENPEGARERQVNRLLTLLVGRELDQEVKQVVASERRGPARVPESGTLAVHPFASRASPEFSVLAKGIAAMVISDLSRVPGLKVLEREKMQKLTDELKLNESGLTDAESQRAIRAGRLLRAEKVVVGSFGVE